MTIECICFRSIEKGTLLGFADFWIPKMGIFMYGCTMHQKNGNRWVNLPSKEIKDKDTSQPKYLNIVRFKENAHYEAFVEMAKQAIDKWCEENAQDKVIPITDSVSKDDECPF